MKISIFIGVLFVMSAAYSATKINCETDLYELKNNEKGYFELIDLKKHKIFLGHISEENPHLLEFYIDSKFTKPFFSIDSHVIDAKKGERFLGLKQNMSKLLGCEKIHE